MRPRSGLLMPQGNTLPLPRWSSVLISKLHPLTCIVHALLQPERHQRHTHWLRQQLKLSCSPHQHTPPHTTSDRRLVSSVEGNVGEFGTFKNLSYLKQLV